MACRASKTSRESSGCNNLGVAMVGSTLGVSSQVTVDSGEYTLDHVKLRLPTFVTGPDVLDNTDVYGATINTFNVGVERSVIDIANNNLKIDFSKVIKLISFSLF
jgi:hypothetical protein